MLLPCRLPAKLPFVLSSDRRSRVPINRECSTVVGISTKSDLSKLKRQTGALAPYYQYLDSRSTRQAKHNEVCREQHKRCSRHGRASRILPLPRRRVRRVSFMLEMPAANVQVRRPRRIPPGAPSTPRPAGPGSATPRPCYGSRAVPTFPNQPAHRPQDPGPRSQQRQSANSS